MPPSSAVTLQESLKFTLLSALRSMGASSASMNGTISGSISTTVTSEPSVANRLANSSPITPPPITARRGGMDSTASMPVESTTCGLSLAPGMGGMTGTEPVARMTWSPV